MSLADHGPRSNLLDGCEGELVALDELLRRPVPVVQAAGSRREPQSAQVAAEGYDARLIDSAVPVDLVAQGLYDAPHVAFESCRSPLVEPAASLRDPLRQGEVVERDHRDQLALAAERNHLAIVVYLGLVEETVLRLDPCPLHREAVRIEAQALQNRHVARVAAVVVDGRAARLLAWRAAPKLPFPPVAVRVVALDLVGGGSGAPEEIVGKFQLDHRWAA